MEFSIDQSAVKFTVSLLCRLLFNSRWPTLPRCCNDHFPASDWRQTTNDKIWRAIHNCRKCCELSTAATTIGTRN